MDSSLFLPAFVLLKQTAMEPRRYVFCSVLRDNDIFSENKSNLFLYGQWVNLYNSERFEDTWFSIVFPKSKLNGLLNCNPDNTGDFGFSSRSLKFLWVYAAISAPCLVPHPIWKLQKNICQSAKILLPSFVGAMNLSGLPMAIGRKPPYILMRAIVLLQKRKVLTVLALFLFSYKV